MRPFALTLALLFAQLPALVAQSAPFELHTSDPKVASRAAWLLQAATGNSAEILELPTCPDGGHLVVALDDEMELDASTADGTTDLEILVDPPALMTALGDAVEIGRMRMRAVLGMAYAAFGIDYDDVAVIVDGLISFPNQVARCRVSVQTPGEDSERTRVRIDLDSVPDTWFARLLASLESPEAEGIRELAGEDALMRAAVALRFAQAYEVLEPAFAPFAAAWTTGSEEREQSLELMRRIVAAYDGTASIAIDANGRICVLTGLADPESQRALLADPAYLAHQRRASSAGGQAEVSLEQHVFEHRGVTLNRLTIASENPMIALPGADAHGRMTTHYGVAKDCFVSAAGDRATAERAIDAVLDAEADLAELPKDTFLVAEAKFAELYRAFAAEFAPEDAEPSLPRNASLTISKQQSTLRIDVSYE